MTLIIGYQGKLGRHFFAADRCASAGGAQHPVLKTYCVWRGDDLYLTGYAGYWGFTGALQRSLASGVTQKERLQMCRDYGVGPNSTAGLAAKVPLRRSAVGGIRGKIKAS